MAKVVVRDLDPRIDGEYPLVGVDDWSYEEWFLVKKISGLVLADFLEAEESGMADTAVIYAIASISLERAGMVKAHMILRHGKLDNIDLVPDEEEIEQAAEEEAKDGPPAPASPESDDSSDDSTEKDGVSASKPSALSVVVPSPTGDQTSHTGSPPSAMSA